MTDEIVPFTIDVPQEQLDDLANRIRHTRWPDQETVAGTDEPWKQGMPLRAAQELALHWSSGYDWRRVEATLNSFPQFRTVIDGLGIHFLHVRSPQEDALPIVLTHGWPGSVVEFLKVIGPLTDPAAHGGDPADAFHVVVPSLPGYAWSDKPDHTGWGVPRIAAAWEQLMLRLGYDRFGAQGGDWGSMVTLAIGAHHTDHLVGVHTNMPLVIPSTPPEEMTPTEAAAVAGLDHYMNWDGGYSTQQSTRPQTLGYGLADSPVGQMAWIVEKFWSWTDCDGDPLNALTADELLDNVSVYWLTNSAASSARLYWESFKHVDFSPIEVPSAISVFPHEIFRTSRRWAETRFSDLRHFDELERGGHFAAFEQPEAFVSQVRSAFRTMR
ncbi:epoxide hydrolase family protein [Dermatobacter hominis]|uniref:epoxide hydrolase family protein n=1 Tax=Dermatobacter hominis TaxID=2884263 RepID=UPI001D128CEE|nr:epoxide hydrolase family protein [Dermatobacter hominis]UDY34807.1 epoxide hydrolase [Dermatobacter hominis]